MSYPGSNYTCICPDQFFGQNCEHRKAKLDVSINDIDIPPYLVAYFFTLSNKSEPIEYDYTSKIDSFSTYCYISYCNTISYGHLFKPMTNIILLYFNNLQRQTISTSINPKQECISN